MDWCWQITGYVLIILAILLIYLGYSTVEYMCRYGLDYKIAKPKGCMLLLEDWLFKI